MESNTIAPTALSAETVITSKAMLKHWQSHRRLTRRVIEAFPEDKFAVFSVGGMRPFAELAMEMIGMAVPGINGIVTGVWKAAAELEHHVSKPGHLTKEEVLRRWDDVTLEIDRQWPKIPPHRFLENDTAFGKYEGPVYGTLFYFIDNEIHHRGQGYVYLRALEIEPPPFWDRS